MIYGKGNILSIKRYGRLTSSSFGLIDDLSLSYTGNQLQKVTDRVTQAVPEDVMHFTDGSNSAIEYTYDDNGNLISDLNKGISSIQYNMLNLPASIHFTNGDSVSYLYSATGSKMQVIHHIGDEQKITDYVGSRIYEDGNLSQLITDEGYITFDGTTSFYHYNVVDHQGNIRAILHQNGSIEQINNYYPFGSLMAESSEADVQQRKYGGKELDRKNGLNLYDYGTRYYDAILGRWNHIDPLAEKNPGFSPYVYCSNNSVNKVDPTGKTDYWGIKDRKLAYLGNDGMDNQDHKFLKPSSKSSISDLKKKISAIKHGEGELESISGEFVDLEIQSVEDQKEFTDKLKTYTKKTKREYGGLMMIEADDKKSKS